MLNVVRMDLDVINKAMCPSRSETDADWQTFFHRMHFIVRPRETRKITHKDISTHNSLFYNKPKTEDGELLWQWYCSFINDTLSAIRRGETCYCFYIYQIAELLQFEHDHLRSKWFPEQKCFKVWLNTEGE